MELIILGSGTYQPELKRHCSGYLLKAGKQNLVFDFGRGTLDQLLKLDVKYYDIDAIFITHTHADHCSELASFLHIALSEPEQESFRKKDVTIYGPKGIKKVIKSLIKNFDLFVESKFHPSIYKVKIKELSNGGPAKGKGWKVKSYKVEHSAKLNCLGYRVESENKIFAYSGDTGDCPGLRKACKNADLAVIEASWPKEIKTRGHLTAEDVGKIAQGIKVKNLVLTHIAPSYLKNFDVKDEARKFYKNPVIIAKDLMKIKI